MTYASITDAQARLQGTGRSVGASTVPNTTQVTDWLTEAEARLNGALNGVGIETPITYADGITILKGYCCDYAEGRARRVSAAAGGDGSNQDGLEELKRFDDYIAWIRSENPATVERELTGGDASTSTTQLRGLVPDDDEDGETDDPEFTKSAGVDQW